MFQKDRFFAVLLLLVLACASGVAWSAEPTRPDTKLVNTEGGQATQGKAPEKQTQNSNVAPGETGNPARAGEMFFTEYQLGLAFGIIGLMGFLFWLLFMWQQKGERASYFGQIYLDTLETLEFGRVSAPIDEKWNQGFYLNELLRASSDRAKAWLDDVKNKKPLPDEAQRKVAREVECEAELIDMQQDLPMLVERRCRFITKSGTTGLPPSWSTEINRRPGSRDAGYGPPGLSRTGGLGSSDGIGRQRVIAPQSPEEEERIQKKDALMAEFSNLQNDWAGRAAAEAWGWYQKEREEAKEIARKQAKRGLDIDFSALRGRGPEFVLEFTAVVVIIFAAVMLGILNILKNEQIGTLLAAIAGYVLGRATTRPRASSETTSTADKDGTATPRTPGTKT